MFLKVGTSTAGGQEDDFSGYTDGALNRFDSLCKGGIFLYQFSFNSSDYLKERERKKQQQSLRSVLKSLTPL